MSGGGGGGSGGGGSGGAGAPAFDAAAWEEAMAASGQEAFAAGADEELADLLDPHPDIHGLFAHYSQLYFGPEIASATVQWSSGRMTLCAGTCEYRGAGGVTIKLSEPILKYRPSRDLKDTLLHEMIHAQLFLDGRWRRDGDHGPLFRSYADKINKATCPDHQRPPGGYRVTVYHSMHAEVDVHRRHRWECKKCGDVVKRAMNRPPQPADCMTTRGKASGSKISSGGEGGAAGSSASGSSGSGGGSVMGGSTPTPVPLCADQRCAYCVHARACGGAYTKVAEPDGYSDKQKGSSKGQGKAAAAGGGGAAKPPTKRPKTGSGSGGCQGSPGGGGNGGGGRLITDWLGGASTSGSGGGGGGGPASAAAEPAGAGQPAGQPPLSDAELRQRCLDAALQRAAKGKGTSASAGGSSRVGGSRKPAAPPGADTLRGGGSGSGGGGGSGGKSGARQGGQTDAIDLCSSDEEERGRASGASGSSGAAAKASGKTAAPAAADAALPAATAAPAAAAAAAPLPPKLPAVRQAHVECPACGAVFPNNPLGSRDLNVHLDACLAE